MPATTPGNNCCLRPTSTEQDLSRIHTPTAPSIPVILSLSKRRVTNWFCICINLFVFVFNTFRGQSVQKIEWKQTDGQTDRRTDGRYRLLYLNSRLTRSVMVFRETDAWHFLYIITSHLLVVVFSLPSFYNDDEAATWRFHLSLSHAIVIASCRCMFFVSVSSLMLSIQFFGCLLWFLFPLTWQCITFAGSHLTSH